MALYFSLIKSRIRFHHFFLAILAFLHPALPLRLPPGTSSTSLRHFSPSSNTDHHSFKLRWNPGKPLPEHSDATPVRVPLIYTGCHRRILYERWHLLNPQGEDMVEGSMIGSRPPRCVGICRECGRCEAVQVPAIPKKRNAVSTNSIKADYSSNYKPLSWKCKCGDLIVNP